MPDELTTVLPIARAPKPRRSKLYQDALITDQERRSQDEEAEEFRQKLRNRSSCPRSLREELTVEKRKLRKYATDLIENNATTLLLLDIRLQISANDEHMIHPALRFFPVEALALPDSLRLLLSGQTPMSPRVVMIQYLSYQIVRVADQLHISHGQQVTGIRILGRQCPTIPFQRNHGGAFRDLLGSLSCRSGK